MAVGTRHVGEGVLISKSLGGCAIEGLHNRGAILLGIPPQTVWVQVVSSQECLFGGRRCASIQTTLSEIFRIFEPESEVPKVRLAAWQIHPQVAMIAVPTSGMD
jgi:hypothetical protein